METSNKESEATKALPEPGQHVTMVYKGRELLGEIVCVNVPKNKKLYPFLTVKHFNGEVWPLEPLAWEVRILKRTYPSEPTE